MRVRLAPVSRAALLVSGVLLATSVEGHAQSLWSNTQGSDQFRSSNAVPPQVQSAGRPPQDGGVPGQTAGSAAPAPKQHVTTTQQPSLFRHPKRGFQLPIPPGVQVAHRGEEMHVTIRSLKGYIVRVQTGDANPKAPSLGMLGRLESRYLGEQGPWTIKRQQREFEFKGVPAIEAIYEGGQTRTRVLIVRGAKTDFVFTFSTSFENYPRQMPVFDWMLENFRMGPGETDAARPLAQSNVPERGDGASVRAAGEVAANAAGRPLSVEAAANPAMTQRFFEPAFGFQMDYPKEWVVDKPTAYTALFSGAEGTPAFDTVVSIQNVSPPNSASAIEAAERALTDLKSNLQASAQNFQVLNETALTESPGRQLLAAYNHQGRPYRKWSVVVPRPEGTVAHIWSFTAPAEQFDAARPTAQAMLRSWTLIQ